MDNDDEPVGRVLGRRQAIAILGLSGMALTAAGSAGAASAEPRAADCVDCVVRPEMTEGPYFVDEGLNRSDIRTDPSDGSVSAGTTLALGLRVLRVDGRRCAPLRGAVVDIWHCDALGAYSDIASEGTSGRKFLRGYQTGDRAGRVRFTTVLPGWYRGRTVHLHIKVQTTGTDGNPYEFTSQLYFTEEFKAEYLTAQPYADKGTPDTTNAEDGIYQAGGAGDQMLLHPRRRGRGYVADFAIGLDLSDTAVGADDGFGGGPPPGGGPGGPPGTGPGGPPPTEPPTS
ncbi:twin-arginine translocation pathway signal protein [Actinophytocola oryzae]|uniref:Dioxygenase-like protein n=1 Tax=Actinophytocola oryzae TaxID=502181 RepID=A0A4R7VFJ5_9PSEU|nr:twin-arginine translocation pathway signal protein [Actinophytocola oryzae]TDV47875.1 dioxygenase-like protein [Actinophytocola oryzae]